MLKQRIFEKKLYKQNYIMDQESQDVHKKN